MNTFFSGRPFHLPAKRAATLLCASAAFFVFTLPASAQDMNNFNRAGTVVVAQEAPVRYGSGGFAPTTTSSSSSTITSSASAHDFDDMTETASPESSGGSYQANLEIRLSQLENQMRELRGQMEEKDHDIATLKEQLNKALADIDMRLNQPSASTPAPAYTPPASGNLQSGDLGNNTSMPPQPVANGSPKAAAPANSPTQQNLGTLSSAPGGASIPPSGGDVASQYESAFTKLKNGDYANAQVEFDRFLKANPNHPLSANATYWYGETFYAQQKFPEASRIFAESYKKYPKGPKAADSLLKLGMSLGGAGKTKEACVSLKQLKKQYPAGNSTLLHRADQEMSKLACT